jgi:hypothetical protein
MGLWLLTLSMKETQLGIKSWPTHAPAFGALLTTSQICPQAYLEIQNDGHLVVTMSGADFA